MTKKKCKWKLIILITYLSLVNTKHMAARNLIAIEISPHSQIYSRQNLAAGTRLCTATQGTFPRLQYTIECVLVISSKNVGDVICSYANSPH